MLAMARCTSRLEKNESFSEKRGPIKIILPLFYVLLDTCQGLNNLIICDQLTLGCSLALGAPANFNMQ